MTWSAAHFPLKSFLCRPACQGLRSGSSCKQNMDFKMINLPLIQSSTRTAAEFQADMFFNDIPAYLHRNLSPNYIQYVHFISC